MNIKWYIEGLLDLNMKLLLGYVIYAEKVMEIKYGLFIAQIVIMLFVYLVQRNIFLVINLLIKKVLQ